MNNIYQTNKDALYLHVESSYLKLPLDFNGSIGDAIIELGKYYNETHEKYSIPKESDLGIDENISLKDYRQNEWDAFKKLYDNENNRRCQQRAAIWKVNDGDVIQVK